MIKERIKYGALFLLLLLSLTIFSQDIRTESDGDRRAKGIESKGDRKFVQQDFDKAMQIYELAFKEISLSPTYSATLHLKIARLYLTLLDYTSAIPHYDVAMTLSEDLFNSTDVCNYLDALRYSGQKMKAIGIARRYAYRDTYHSDQRYQNILHALNYEDGFLPIGIPEFSVSAQEMTNTPNSEFWIGEVQGEYFYATSNSRFHDSHKKFYHRTRYYPLNKKAGDSSEKEKNQERSLIDMVPSALQNGPLSLSKDMSKMIITGISYGKGESIGITGQGINAFQTKLYFSRYNTKRKGWSSFTEAFPQKAGYSYSHPFLFNNDQSLLFSSDMPGGFGGYDIYVAHWDEQHGFWGLPVNLGAQINTEGDEITPSLFEDMLIFASNGHVGFGGYDIYGISYESGQILEGSLVHFSYPINTIANDFSMLNIDRNTGYIISDRNLTNKDDIFFFERNINFGKSNLLFGMSETQSIASNVINLPINQATFSTPRKEELPEHVFTEHMLSLYFDFDRSELRQNALKDLNSWVKHTNFNYVKSLVIEGYADEIGEDGYNFQLSQQRAQAVTHCLESLDINIEITPLGKGSVSIPKDPENSLSISFLDGNLFQNNYKSPWDNRVWMNREARRVDIIATLSNK